MSLTASQICAIARNRARAPGFTVQSGQYLNNALEEICLTGDYEIAKQDFNFTFSGATAPIGNLTVQLASGPFPLPPDYLRTKKGDVQFYPLQQWPFQLTPIDISEFDHLVQQAGLQSYPVYWVVDIAKRRVFKSTITNTVAGSGILTIPTGGDLTGVSVGQGVFGDAIAPGTVTLVTGIAGNQITVAPAANVISTFAAPAISSVIFARCPNAYVWPPASGAFPCFVRYYSKMADIAIPESSTQTPWFEYTDLLIDGVTGRLMKDTGDPRWIEFVGEGRPDSVPTRLRKYLQMVDDHSNRARSITLDRRRFGSGWNVLPKSKILGY